MEIEHMNDETELSGEDAVETGAEEAKNDGRMPLLIAHGEGYITRKDGTIVPFTLHGEM